jgi:ribosomal protein S8
LDIAQLKREKEARYEEYCETYAKQLQLQGYINSLEKDNENINDTMKTATKGKRRLKKLIKINDKDIKKYNKALSQLPPVPPFK